MLIVDRIIPNSSLFGPPASLRGAPPQDAILKGGSPIGTSVFENLD